MCACSLSSGPSPFVSTSRTSSSRKSVPIPGVSNKINRERGTKVREEGEGGGGRGGDEGWEGKRGRERGEEGEEGGRRGGREKAGKGEVLDLLCHYFCASSCWILMKCQWLTNGRGSWFQVHVKFCCRREPISFLPLPSPPLSSSFSPPSLSPPLSPSLSFPSLPLLCPLLPHPEDINIPANRPDAGRKQVRLPSKGEPPDTPTPVATTPATPLPVATPDYAAGLGSEYDPMVG